MKPTTHAIYGTDLTQHASVLIEGIRSQLSRLRGQLGDIIREHPYTSGHLHHVQGNITCSLVALAHANVEIMKVETLRDDKARGPSLSFRSRGIGSDQCPGCFVCGGETGLMDNISAFVASKEEGEQIVAWFGGRARLDFRDYEPNWIQVKVGACATHRGNLEHLQRLVSVHGRIRQRDIQEATVTK